jgi:HSP20 family molecular chaperone IbpA
MMRNLEGYCDDFEKSMRITEALGADFGIAINRGYIFPKRNHTDKEMILTWELAGLDKSQVKVTIEGNVLGVVAQEKSKGVLAQVEIANSFDLDKIKVSMKNGLLEVRIPRRGSGNKTRDLPIE